MATPTGTMAGGAELFSTPPRPSSQDLSQDPNSNRAKTTTPRSTTPRGRKKLPFVLQNLKSAEEKQAYIETLEKELDALFRYYKEAVAEKVRVELSQCGGSRNAVVAALLEESDLPLSKLVEEIHDRLNGEVGSGAIILAEPVTYATVKSSVLFAGQRVTYGLSNADADVLEDYSESCLWCWETRDMKLLPQSIRGQLGIRRMCRKRIHDRISAVSEMIAALKRLECEPNFNDALKKASTKLSKAFPEADIRLLVDSSMQKNSEAMDKKRANQENKLLMKQLERNRRESEKEKASMHNELQRETQPNANESDSQLSQGEAKNDDKCTINKQQQKKQVEETKRDQRRREKAEAELKKKRSLEKQASLMERFLKKCKTNSSPENDKVSTKSAASDLSSSKNEGLFESATLSMDCTLASSNDVTLEDIRKSHFSSWRSLGQSIRSNRKQNWGIRQMPRTEVFKELKLTTIKTDVHDDELDMEKNGDKLGGCSSDISLCPVNGDGSLPDDKKYRRARQLFQFDKSHRPAFYGVWPTKSHIVGARHPLRKDPSLDYDVSSDEEWEEEEPGESLSDCDKDEEDCQEECSKSDEESEDGFFVPDGYLSENEGAQVDGMEMEGDTKGNDSSSSYNEEFCSLLRQQKYINSLTDLALRKNQPLIITNFNHEKELSSDHSTGGISKMEQKCLQALSMYIVPGGSLVEIPEGKMQDEEQKVHRPDGKGGASSTSSVAAISDSDLLTIVTTIQSCSQGMNKVLGSLQQKLPSVPKSLMKNKVREVSEYVDNRLQVKKEVLDKLGLTEKPEGYMVQLLNLVVHNLAAPALHNSGFAGSCSRIWQRDSYWDARPSSRSNEYPLFIPRQNYCSTAGENSWSTDKSSSNFGVASMESEKRNRPDSSGNSNSSYSLASSHSVQTHRDLQKGISLLKKSVACITAYCYNYLCLDAPSEGSTFESFAKLLATLSSSKEVRSVFSLKMAQSRTCKQVQQLNKSVWSMNSAISSTTLLESAHSVPSTRIENYLPSSTASFLYATDLSDGKNECLIEGWDIVEHPTFPPPPSQSEDVEHWTRAMFIDAKRK